jgi:hypothetical protein
MKELREHKRTRKGQISAKEPLLAGRGRKVAPRYRLVLKLVCPDGKQRGNGAGLYLQIMVEG